MILLTKAHLQFMTHDTRLTFQDTRVAGRFITVFLQVGQAHHVAGDAHQIVAADVGAEFSHPHFERAEAELHYRLRVTFHGFIQGQNIADPRGVVGVMRRDGQ